jgi:hypothetical protein
MQSIGFLANFLHDIFPIAYLIQAQIRAFTSRGPLNLSETLSPVGAAFSRECIAHGGTHTGISKYSFLKL